jgi:hypothetical protein
VIRKCYSFLNIDSNFIPKGSLDNTPQKVNYSLPRIWLLSKKNQFQFDYNANRTRFFLRPQTRMEMAFCKAIDKIDRYLFQPLVDQTHKPSFNQSIKAKLIDLYENDISKLETLLSLNLSAWRE